MQIYIYIQDIQKFLLHEFRKYVAWVNQLQYPAMAQQFDEFTGLYMETVPGGLTSNKSLPYMIRSTNWTHSHALAVSVEI